jgi:hypothetical protein
MFFLSNITYILSINDCREQILHLGIIHHSVHLKTCIFSQVCIDVLRKLLVDSNCDVYIYRS